MTMVSMRVVDNNDGCALWEGGTEGTAVRMVNSLVMVVAIIKWPIDHSPWVSWISFIPLLFQTPLWIPRQLNFTSHPLNISLQIIQWSQTTRCRECRQVSNFNDQINDLRSCDYIMRLLKASCSPLMKVQLELLMKIWNANKNLKNPQNSWCTPFQFPPTPHLGILPTLSRHILSGWDVGIGFSSELRFISPYGVYTWNLLGAQRGGSRRKSIAFFDPCYWKLELVNGGMALDWFIICDDNGQLKSATETSVRPVMVVSICRC